MWFAGNRAETRRILSILQEKSSTITDWSFDGFPFLQYVKDLDATWRNTNPHHKPTSKHLRQTEHCFPFPKIRPDSLYRIIRTLFHCQISLLIFFCCINWNFVQDIVRSSRLPASVVNPA